MFAIQARYRGNARRRADLVRESAAALSTLTGIDSFDVLGVEDIASVIETAEACCDATLALISHGDWAVAIGVAATAEAAIDLAAKNLNDRARAGTVKAGVYKNKTAGQDISDVFGVLGFILTKRTAEGREATSLMRTGLNQIEAAERLGISKQAMSQRLQAAGWQAELSGWRLALRTLDKANNLD